MAKVFLDTNILIDITRGPRNKDLPKAFDQYIICISPLSVNILYYSSKTRVPNTVTRHIIDEMKIIDLTKSILDKSLDGPTSDLEDNIQLHSAVEADCDFFITRDRQLLKLRYFGKTKIATTLSPPV